MRASRILAGSVFLPYGIAGVLRRRPRNSGGAASASAAPFLSERPLSPPFPDVQHALAPEQESGMDDATVPAPARLAGLDEAPARLAGLDEAMARLAGLDEALAAFPDDVAAAAAQAGHNRDRMAAMDDPTLEPWPPMQAGRGL